MLQASCSQRQPKGGIRSKCEALVMTTVNDGETLKVSSGQERNGIFVLAGGTISTTVDSFDVVSAGGRAVLTLVLSGGGQIGASPHGCRTRTPS